uniref:DNA-directed RNA polymerase subunit beta'' n=1 Tax=Netrium digitus TaxID=43946 RepID=A0A191T564_9VIRI|nr:beta'' subunit of RNA polymerase [Netrium digitus]ANI25529.1 beta'' subunit of RNA polymerase [Netrium digitus]
MGQLAIKCKNMIFHNQVMDKGSMRQLIGRLVAYLGDECTARILDQLKSLGFRYATQAGISLGIDDLLTTPSKTWIIQDSEHQICTSEEQYLRGCIHSIERLRHVVETWHTTSEYLKREMHPHFRSTDPLNPVHMMCFSGARASTSQVHQLVGMRGLMANPQGNIIDLPIQSNFREGLSLTEYIISCYGARKGVVDTAVRTADAGYLTRRLVEVAQHVVVSHRDCSTIQGISLRPIRISSGSTLHLQDRLIGRVLARHVYHFSGRCIAVRNQDVGPDLAICLTSIKNDNIMVRSPLTCQNMPKVCQLCYGWDLSYGGLVELGAAMGIVAGQSIGEPGTQLTLRTFHTGGVFTGDIAEHVRAPFNGVIHFEMHSLQPTRNRHGRPAWTCYQTLPVTIQHKSGKKHCLDVPQHSLLVVRNKQYVQSKQVIAEVRTTKTALKQTVQKDIYSPIQGEVYYQYTSLRMFCTKQRFFVKNYKPLSSLLNFTYSYNHSSAIANKTSYVWILSGELSEIFRQDLGICFYKTQDYIQTSVCIGKESPLINNNENFFKNVFSRHRIMLNNLRLSHIIGIHNGAIYTIRKQQKCVLMLRSVDHFKISICNINNKINELQINKKLTISSVNQVNSHKNSKISSSIDLQDYHKNIIENQRTLIQCFSLGRLVKCDSKIQFFGFPIYRHLFYLNFLHQSFKKGTDNKYKFIYNGVFVDEAMVTHTLKVDTIYSSLLIWLYQFEKSNFLLSKRYHLNLGQFVWRGAATVFFGVLPESGQVLAIWQYHLVIRLAKPYLVPVGTTVNAYHKQLIHQGDTLMNFIYERLKSSDIVQGLPKAEQLLEARLGSRVVSHLDVRFNTLINRVKYNLDKYVKCLMDIDFMLSQVSTNRSRAAFINSQIETVDQVQTVYLSQGVRISDKHVEIIVRQMTSKVIIVENADPTSTSVKGIVRVAYPHEATGVFFPGELIDLSRAESINRVLSKPIACKPILLGMTKASLNTNSFLSEASFERTIAVLSRSALQGRTDWLKGLKENVLVSNIIPAGTGCEQVNSQTLLYNKQKISIFEFSYQLSNTKIRRNIPSLKNKVINRKLFHDNLRQSTINRSTNIFSQYKINIEKSPSYIRGSNIYDILDKMP